MIPVVLERIETFVNSKTFWLRPEKPVQYVAGQFTEVFLPHDKPDERGIRRWFTLSSSPTEPLLAITTKFPETTSTFKRQLASLPIGTPLKIADPMGDFVLPKDVSIPLLFVASGIGVTPVRSMVQYLADIKEKRDITILYDVHKAEDLLYSSLFAAYGTANNHFVHMPSPGYTGPTSRITTADIKNNIQSQRTLIYLSGPEPLVEKLGAELEKCGVEKYRIIIDYFSGYTEV